MILEYTDVSHNYHETVDVVIIGSGCGAATTGKELAAAGHNVLMLERGGYYTTERGDFDQRSDAMAARIDGDRALGTSSNGELSLMYGNCVGGASVHYWGDSWRLPDDRAKEFEKMGVEHHSCADLAPHFDRIEKDLNIHVHGPEYYNRMNQIFDEAASRLGWHVEGVPQARKNCAGSGHCFQGCSYDAKQSQLVTHIPAFTKAGGRIFADCQVEKITVDNEGAANGVEAVFLGRTTGKPGGYTLRVNAKIVVLAAGGFSSPVIWMKSGLPNGSGQVGKNLLCNPNPYVYGFFHEKIRLWENVPAATGTADFRLAKYDASGSYIEGGYLLHPNQIQVEYLAVTLPGFGVEHQKLVKKLEYLGSAVFWIDDEVGGEVRLSDSGEPIYDYTVQGVDMLKARDAFMWEILITLVSPRVYYPFMCGRMLLKVLVGFSCC